MKNEKTTKKSIQVHFHRNKLSFKANIPVFSASRRLDQNFDRYSKPVEDKIIYFDYIKKI